MRAVALAVTLCFVAAPLAHAEDGDSPAQHYRRGLAAYELEDWDAAIREFEAGFRLEPRAPFLFNIAQAHRRAGHLDEALKFYRKYLELAPDASDRAEVERNMADLGHEIDEKERAAHAASEALRAPPTPQAPAPAPAPPSPPSPPPRDWLGIGLLGAGALVAVVGGAVAIYGVVADGQATDASSHVDLARRVDLERTANGASVAGYVTLGVGAALLVGGLLKITLGRSHAAPSAERALDLHLVATPGLAAVAVEGRF